MVIIFQGSPLATPRESMLRERLITYVTLGNKPRDTLFACDVNAAGVGKTGRRQHRGVQARVDIASQPLAMLRPTGRLTRQRTRIDGRGMIIRHGRGIVPTLMMNKAHLFDGKSGLRRGSQRG